MCLPRLKVVTLSASPFVYFCLFFICRLRLLAPHAVGHVFLGFTRDGRHMLSYSTAQVPPVDLDSFPTAHVRQPPTFLCADSSTHSPCPFSSSKFYLNVWQCPTDGRRMTHVLRLPLFGERAVPEELLLQIVQQSDSVIIVCGTP